MARTADGGAVWFSFSLSLWPSLCLECLEYVCVCDETRKDGKRSGQASQVIYMRSKAVMTVVDEEALEVGVVS